jgi:hypothetical protein
LPYHTSSNARNFSVFDAHFEKVKIHWAPPEGSQHFLGGKFHFEEIFVHANGMEIRCEAVTLHIR